MATYVVTAMFSSCAEAEQAIQRLAQELRAECAVVRAAEDGFPAALASLLICDEDRHILAEGLRLGCVLVTAAVAEGDTSRAADLLDDAGALDLDAQGARWGLRDDAG